MMYKELYQYLLQHKQLTVPGIGTFLLERRPAAIDFPNKKINPPVYAVALHSTINAPAKTFFNWLGNALHISDNEAADRFNAFAFSLKKQVTGGDIINWNGVGIISKGLAGDVKLMSTEVLLPEKSITAEKVIRQKAEHMVRVGEEEKTSAEMTVMLNRTKEKKSYWWVAALIVVLLTFLFIGWHFSEHGIDISSTANRIKSVPQEVTATYRLIP